RGSPRRGEVAAGGQRVVVEQLRGAMDDLRLSDDVSRPFPEALGALVYVHRTMAVDCEIGLHVLGAPGRTGRHNSESVHPGRHRRRPHARLAAARVAWITMPPPERGHGRGRAVVGGSAGQGALGAPRIAAAPAPPPAASVTPATAQSD